MVYSLFDDGDANRIELPYVVAEADSGNIGGNLSHEFHVLNDAGKMTNRILHQKEKKRLCVSVYVYCISMLFESTTHKTMKLKVTTRY